LTACHSCDCNHRTRERTNSLELTSLGIEHHESFNEYSGPVEADGSPIDGGMSY
jgi:hypothetical protein